MNIKRKILFSHIVLMCAGLGAQNSVIAQETIENEQDQRHEVLEEIVVTATPIPRTAVEMSQSATVLRKEALDRELNNNIGETLTRLPGLSNASFGQNVGRPVIRGMQGVRVGVLNDNMTSSDVSAVSQDHAVPTEPFLADQVEVLRGPATLIYGSGSIGGVVNTVTNTIPTAVPENGVEGRVVTQIDSAADERYGAGRIDFGSGSFAVHASAFYRRSDDYEIPGAAELFEDDHDDDHDDEHGHEEGEVFGVLENSFLDNEGGAVGASWIGDSWTIGMSYTGYDSDYGIPGAHAHAHGEEDDDHDDDHGDENHDDDEHGGEEEELVTIGLESKRYNGLILGQNPLAGFEQLKFDVAVTDYTHTEFEGAETGTVFDSETADARLELRHDPMGRWTGAFGGQWTDRDFSALGEEAFVPPSQTDSWALFWVESAEFDNWRLDLGIRYEDTTIDSFLIEHHHEEDDHGDGHDDDHDDEHGDEMPEPASRGFSPLSFSAAAVWHVTEASHLAFTFASAERAPNDAELFSNGPHLATQTFEVGNPDLKEETNRHYEVSWRTHSGPVTGSISIYYNDFDDYIFEADTGEMEDGLPERVWSQQDAEFFGGEIEFRWDMARNNFGHWQLFGFFDWVDAELSDGSNVPRIPPQRLGLGLDWDMQAWAANVTWINADDQSDTAEFETPTPGYDLLNAELTYQFNLGDRTGVEVFLQGKNLLDEDIRNSTSFLKDQAPQAGRNYVLGARFAF